MAKTNSEILLRYDYLLLQKCSTELENLALPNHLQLNTLFVSLPLPAAPGSAPVWGLFFYTVHFKRMKRYLRQSQPICLSLHFSTLGYFIHPQSGYLV